jgi:hypothetical protein
MEEDENQKMEEEQLGMGCVMQLAGLISEDTEIWVVLRKSIVGLFMKSFS